MSRKTATLNETARLVLDSQIMGVISNSQGLALVNRQLAINGKREISAKHYSKVKTQLQKRKEDMVHTVLQDKLLDNHDSIYELRLVKRQMWGIANTTKDENLRLRTLAEIRGIIPLISRYHEESGEIGKQATAEREVLRELA